MVGRGGGRFGRGGRRDESRACFWLNPGKTDRMRASDEGRERTVAVLRDRALDGCLTLDTFAGRVDAAYRAKTVEELDVLVADLPHSDGWRASMRRARPPPGGPPRPAPPPARGVEGPLWPRAGGR